MNNFTVNNHTTLMKYLNGDKPLDSSHVIISSRQDKLLIHAEKSIISQVSLEHPMPSHV